MENEDEIYMDGLEDKGERQRRRNTLKKSAIESSEMVLPCVLLWGHIINNNNQ